MATSGRDLNTVGVRSLFERFLRSLINTAPIGINLKHGE